MSGWLLRSTGAAGAAVLLVFAAACGDDDADDAADEPEPMTTYTIAAQSYIQREPVQVADDTEVDDIEPGEVVDTEQEHTVQAGDHLTRIASVFEVSPEEIANYNRWVDGVSHAIHPGDTILIPPGAVKPPTVAEPSSTTTTAPPLAGADVATTSDAGGAVTQGAGDNCGEGTYTVETNDYPIGVADKFDVTLDALDAANETTAGYDSFYPGTQIVIPAKSDC